MTTYRAPLRDMRFILHDLAGIDQVANLAGWGACLDVLDPVLDEAAAFASEVLDPLNRAGDRVGCTWNDGRVTTPPGFREAYKKFADAGWIGFPVEEEYGGQGLPNVLLAAALEMWNAANVGFANGPLLNQGAIEAIELTGSDDQKRRYIPNLVSGKWTGTMCLTEPQAGSDLAQVRATAVPDGDRYRLRGQKMFITFGEHDMAENIIHLVLARLPGSPEGTRGISMFIVPKFLVNADGTLGARNDVYCSGIEHKLGINANPTCTLNYGARGEGAVGELVGEANKGLENMFIMMNAARFSVGVQAIGLADRAYQSALEYAKQRVQGRDANPASKDKSPKPIVEHPDVRRMLMWMKAHIEAMRALALVTAAAGDVAARHADEKVRKERRAFVEFMIPIIKGWSTEVATDLCSTALQVFGGMGYIEEAGIAQQYRDVRITSIYEGTTGIQAMDLVGRKLVRDMGATATRIIGEIKQTVLEARQSDDADVKEIAAVLAPAADALSDVSQWTGMTAMADVNLAFACSVPYLKLWGIVAGGWQMLRAAIVAAERLEGPDGDFYRAKLATARFYADHVLSQAPWYRHEIREGARDVMSLEPDQFDLDRSTMVAV